jgi:hypothetical protein
MVCACGSATTLTLRPTKATSLELVPAPQISEYAYKTLLIIASGPISLKDISIDAIGEKKKRYYLSKVEKSLLKKGFRIISSEIVARAERGIKAGLSPVEKAMVMGKKTKADAVLILEAVDVRGRARHFVMGDNVASEVAPGEVRVDERKKLIYHAKTEQCLYRVPYYDLRIEAKLIDTASGNVLWVGNGKQSVTDVMKKDWVAKLEGDCELVDQSFIYTDYMAREETLDLVVAALLERLLTPLKNEAMRGQPIEAEPPQKAEPPPAPAPEPKKKMAVVSSRRAYVREGPGKRNKRKMKIPRKAKVEVLETMGEWIKVKIQDGSVGWLHESTVIIPD